MRRLSALTAVVVMTMVAGGAAQQGKPVVAPKAQVATPGTVPAQPAAAGGAVVPRVGGAKTPAPTKVVDVKPVYPASAKDAGIQGVVILEVSIGKDGKVTAAKVLRSIPQLDQAAIDAVKQWEYTPTLKNGVPVPVSMTVTVSFKLAQSPAAGGAAVPRVGGAKMSAPTKVVDVKAVYPEAAREARIQGAVILELSIGKDGKVTAAKVLRSIPELDQAAIDAATQWEFTPTLKDGVPVAVVMAVTVNFKLQ
jgi:TonB family protein